MGTTVATGGVDGATAARSENMLEHDLSNALVESTNTKIRLLTRMELEFRDSDALIDPAMLALGGYRSGLPVRQAA